MHVTVTNYHVRQRKDGETFIVLTLTGGLELVQSQVNGQFRAVVRKCQIPANFDEATAKMVLGTQMPGSIVRVQSDPYTYINEATGEQFVLTHQWRYCAPGTTVPVPDIAEITELA